MCIGQLAVWGPCAKPPCATLCGTRYEVDIYEGRQWIGGKVASYVDKDGNHIEVGRMEEEGWEERGRRRVGGYWTGPVRPPYGCALRGSFTLQEWNADFAVPG